MRLIRADLNKMCADRRTPKPEDDDAALFRRAAGRVRRLQDDRVQHPRARPRPAPRDDLSRDASEAGGDPYASASASDPGPMFHASPGVQRKIVRKLKRGQIRIDDELDLHGMRVKEAGEALERFLTECSERGYRCVRVIHGKGLRTGGSVLKENVATWLRLRRDVVAFCSATPADGGTGAVYVLLKK